VKAKDDATIADENERIDSTSTAPGYGGNK
jgi:hypothetical protein